MRTCETCHDGHSSAHEFAYPHCRMKDSVVIWKISQSHILNLRVLYFLGKELQFFFC